MLYFEYDLIEIVKQIKFKKPKSKFQRQLRQDISSIKRSDKTLTFADKTENIYKLTKEEYGKLINDAITTTYKKASNKIPNLINAEGK